MGGKSPHGCLQRLNPVGRAPAAAQDGLDFIVYVRKGHYIAKAGADFPDTGRPFGKPSVDLAPIVSIALYRRLDCSANVIC